MTLSASGQAVVANDLLVRMGATGSFYGISAAADGSVATKLNVTVTATAWLLLANGDFYDTVSATPLASASVTGLSTNGTYTLWADQALANQTTAPAFTVSTVAPSTRAVAIAQVVVSGSVISAVYAYAAGLQGARLGGGSRFLQGTLAFNSAGGAVSLGVLPAGAVLDYAVSSVTTAFNAGTNNFLSLGKVGSTAAYLAAATNGLTTATSTVLAGLVPGSVGGTDVPVLASYTQSGGAATTGATIITLYYHL